MKISDVPGAGISHCGFESWQGLGIFLFTTASRQALAPTHAPDTRDSFSEGKAARAWSWPLTSI